MSLPVHGVNGNYASVSEALNAGETYMTIVEQYIEENPWIFGSMEYKINILPNVTVFYNSSLPMMTSDASYSIEINGGSISTLSQYVTSLGNTQGSNITFNYVTFNLSHPSTVMSSNSTVFTNCLIYGNVLTLAEEPDSDVTCNESAFYCTVVFRNKDIYLSLYNCAIYGALRLYANYSNLPLDGTILVPTFFIIADSYISILMISSTYTEGTSFFAGCDITSSWIDNLLNSSVTPTYIAFCDFSDNDLIYTNIPDINMYSVKFSNNVLFSDIALNRCLDVKFTGNNFENVNLLALEKSSFDNNKMVGLSVVDCKDSTINGNNGKTITSIGTVFDTIFNGNSVSSLTFRGLVENNLISNTSNATITMTSNATNIILEKLVNSKIRFKSTSDSIKISDNKALNVKFRGLCTRSNIAFNTGPGVVTFYCKVYKGQIVNNTDVTFRFKKKVYSTIVTQNIIPHGLDVRSKCSMIKNNIIGLGC